MASKPKPPTDTLPEAANEDALRSRIAELESRETEHARSEQLQGALFRIAEAASAASDLQAFYREVHATVGTLMSAENFYIALYEAIRELEASTAANEIFGEDVVAHYLNAARVEQEQYDAVVHNWDRERYLERS